MPDEKIKLVLWMAYLPFVIGIKCSLIPDFINESKIIGK